MRPSRAGQHGAVLSGLPSSSERGFQATSTDEIVSAAGLSRGALYHHFSDKASPFEAVLEAVEAHLVQRVSESVRAIDPMEALAEGVSAFLDACLDPEVARIALVEAPGVLGWQRWREIDSRYGLGLVIAGLQAALDAGDPPPQPVDPLAQVVFGALTEAAVYVAHTEHPDQARAAVEPVLLSLLDGLRDRPWTGRHPLIRRRELAAYPSATGHAGAPETPSQTKKPCNSQ